MKRIDLHLVESDEDYSPESISDTKNWLNWNGDLDNPNDSKDNWEADNESDMSPDSRREDSATPEHRNMSVAPNVLKLIGSTWQSKKRVEEALMTVNIIETGRNNGIKTKTDRICQCIISKFIM